MRDVSAPLLAIDGDSLAHRAYHALPKSMRSAKGLPSGAIVGFANFLLRLWESEQPRTVMVGWDCVGEPTYRLEAFPAYQSGRVFDPELLEQLELLPELVRSLGFVAGKQPGYEADDFLAAAVAQEEKRGGETLVATSDRDAFQLVSERTTVLQPVKGVSELARIGPAEVRERYGVDPRRCRTSSRSAATRPTSSRARRASARRRRRRSSPSTARWRRCSTPEVLGAAGGVAPLPANRDDGRLCPSPLPSRSNAQLGGGVHHRESWGLGNLAGRFEALRLMEIVSHAALARAAPTEHHPSRRGASPLCSTRSARSRRPSRRRSSRSSAATTRGRPCGAASAGSRARRGSTATPLRRRRATEAALLAGRAAPSSGADRRLRAHPAAPATTRPPTGRWASGLFNNAAVAARTVQAEDGLERVAILDWTSTTERDAGHLLGRP
jgi:hypothetical protein